MYQIVCTDMLGESHDVPADEMRLYTFAHGVHVTDEGVLLVKDKLSGQWILPGGMVEKKEKEIDGLRRGILAGTGLTIGNEAKLLTIIEEDFYDIYLNEGAHITREFFLVLSVEAGTLMQNGNGVYTSSAAYVPTEVWRGFSEKDMRKKYKDIITTARGILSL